MAIPIVIGCLLWLLLFGCLGWWVAAQCGRNTDEGFVLGMLLGPIGLLIIGILPRGSNPPSDDQPT